MEEDVVLEVLGVLDVSEGHEHLNVLTGLAVAQCSGIDLIVACFKIMAILDQDGERDFLP